MRLLMQAEFLSRVATEYEGGLRRLMVALVLVTASAPVLTASAYNEVFYVGLVLPCVGLFVMLPVKPVVPRGSWWPVLVGPAVVMLIAVKLGEIGGQFGARGVLVAAGIAFFLAAGFALSLRAYVRDSRPDLTTLGDPASTHEVMLSALVAFDVVHPDVVSRMTDLAWSDQNQALEALENRGLVRRIGGLFTRRERRLISPTRAGRDAALA